MIPTLIEVQGRVVQSRVDNSEKHSENVSWEILLNIREIFNPD